MINLYRIDQRPVLIRHNPIKPPPQAPAPSPDAAACLTRLDGRRWREALPSCAANTLFGACVYLVRDAVVPRHFLWIEKRENAIRSEVTFSWR
jgi:hypothetical protein